MKRTGKIVAVNGNLVSAAFADEVRQNETALIPVGDDRLRAEVIRIRGRTADLQVFEETRGLSVGDEIEFQDELLSVELGPGLLSGLFDGLQNPLRKLADEYGTFLKRGRQIPALDPNAEHNFTPTVSVGDKLRAGMAVGTVPEGPITHTIQVPYDLRGHWTVRGIHQAGPVRVSESAAELEQDGVQKTVTLSFRHPIRRAIRAYAERLAPREPLSTRIRIIDSLFPVAKGGTYCIPGPFGAGKTILQQLTSRFAEVDVVIVAACGERAGEVVETIDEFPKLIDPRTGRSLAERTIIVVNTSSMPPAARESSVYTAVTMAEYYRQMGLDVLLLADSTSRWAQALRERSGRLEEIPGEEAFPAYLQSVIADFYERSGRVRLHDGRIGSVTIGGTVSPAGGNFEEPVTQSTLKVVGAFHGLSRERSDARRYPAVDPLDSWSRYEGAVSRERRERLVHLLRRSREVDQMTKVVGDEGVSPEDYLILLKGEFFDAVYLQQNAFDPVDASSSGERQNEVLEALETILAARLAFVDRGKGRAFFHQLRRLCLDWNGIEYPSEEFQTAKADILRLVQENCLKEAVAEETRAALVETDLDSSFSRSAVHRPETRQSVLLAPDTEGPSSEDESGAKHG